MKNVHMCYIRVTEGKIENWKKEVKTNGKIENWKKEVKTNKISSLIFIYTIQSEHKIS